MTGGQALVLAGHGSHRNPGSAVPVLAHADRIRSRGIFAEVHAGFWKEEPALRQILRTVTSETVFVVPIMMSEGYFVDQVFPRELGLTEQSEIETDKSIHYTPPIGTHPSMTDVVINRATTVTDNPRVGPGVGLILVGHGTERTQQSAETTIQTAARIRARERFDEVTALFMDEEPTITDWEAHVKSDEVIVVPFFVADGYHTQEDIPADVGLTPTATGTYRVPGSVNGRQIWYTGAVGTDPGLNAVIVERARDAGAILNTTKNQEEDSVSTDHQDLFLSWLAKTDHDSRRWGELLITARDTDDYAVRHHADRDAPPDHLESLPSPEAVRDRTRFDNGGQYRPLRGAPTLPTGWHAPGLSAQELVSVVESVYPVSINDWARLKAGELNVESFEKTAHRQTGLYAGLDAMSPRELASTISACCDNCVKRREWDAEGVSRADEASHAGEFPCPHPCSFVIAAAREFMEIDPAEEPADVDPSIRPGDVGKPGNRYRVRYREAHQATGKSVPVSGEQR